ncbi:MAG: hypothetical protein HUU19_02010 [Phycisphaerales bacterium]|nr:hypothetical protein [Phycisphaerales bacterium]
MSSVSAIALVGGLSCLSAAGATPPVQLAGDGIRIEPIAIAPAWIENGKVVIGEWQDYPGVQTRGRKGMYYAFDAFGGYVDEVASRATYVNHANGGRGADPGQARFHGTAGCDPGLWYFPNEAIPTVVEDIESEACGSSGGFPIDGLDFGWYWGGGSCVVSFFPSDDSAACADGDPFAHTYNSGVSINFGWLTTGGHYFASVDGIYSQHQILAPMPTPGGSYLAMLTEDGSTPATGPGTQFVLWGTGEDSHEPYRAGTQGEAGWMDLDSPYGSFEPSECVSLAFGLCPDPLAPIVGFLGRRCPADVNWDGFVNGDDYDVFAESFEVGTSCADLNGDGFANGDDFDAFASWFDEGC